MWRSAALQVRGARRACRLACTTALRTLTTSSGAPRTLFDKIWQSHVVDTLGDDGEAILYIDRHVIHELTSPQAFSGLRAAGRAVRRPDRTLATADHNVPTDRGRLDHGVAGMKDVESRNQLLALEKNAADFGVEYWGMDDKRQGIVHVIGPEQGFTLPGLTVACGDSHTPTNGAFGALAIGIGTSEVEHVLATQTLIMKPLKNMRIQVEGALQRSVTAKDLILHICGLIGISGGTGHVIEFAGPAVQALSLEGRMTVCNMAIEAGARVGIIAPDEATYKYIKGRPMAPQGDMWDRAVEYWQQLPSDTGASYGKEVSFDGAEVAPQVTWGTTPEDVLPITGTVPSPKDFPGREDRIQRSLDYMGLQPGQKLDGLAVDKIFIGSCTNSRIEDLRMIADVVRNAPEGARRVPDGVHALVVPGSGLVKALAEEEGVAQVLIDAGFDWREPGCSMCLGMNADKVGYGERCASTSNRNFEGRQGRGARTHLVSPAMAAAAALTGRLTDVRALQSRGYHTSCPRHMQPFKLARCVPAPFPMDNVDTDMIIPAEYLKTVERTGLGKGLFDRLRYDSARNDIPEFVLNKPTYRNAEILIAGKNFGCGSSREHAPWALLDHGIRCIVSQSFADIFYNNCFKNGILPIRLPAEQVALLMGDADNAKEIEVDLQKMQIRRLGASEVDVIDFEVEPFRRHCLLNGLDDISLTLEKEEAIARFEKRMEGEMPWA